MYGKIIFNNIEYVKLFPVFNASTAVFVFYPHLIHMYSTQNPHKTAELSTLMPYFISEKKRQIASPSPSNVVHPLSGNRTSICLFILFQNSFFFCYLQI